MCSALPDRHGDVPTSDSPSGVSQQILGSFIEMWTTTASTRSRLGPLGPI